MGRMFFATNRFHTCFKKHLKNMSLRRFLQEIENSHQQFVWIRGAKWYSDLASTVERQDSRFSPFFP